MQLLTSAVNYYFFKMAHLFIDSIELRAKEPILSGKKRERTSNKALAKNH